MSGSLRTSSSAADHSPVVSAEVNTEKKSSMPLSRLWPPRWKPARRVSSSQSASGPAGRATRFSAWTYPDGTRQTVHEAPLMTEGEWDEVRADLRRLRDST